MEIKTTNCYDQAANYLVPSVAVCGQEVLFFIINSQILNVPENMGLNFNIRH